MSESSHMTRKSHIMQKWRTRECRERGPMICTSLWWLTLLCAAFLSFEDTCLAAKDVSAKAAPTQAEQQIGQLLDRVEQQVSAGHAMSPAGDNAMDTWKRMLKIYLETPISPRVRTSVVDFVAHMRDRAAKEKTDGNSVTASDLSVFADQGNHLLGLPGSVPPTAENTRTDRPQPAPDGQPTAEVEAAVLGLALAETAPRAPIAQPPAGPAGAMPPTLPLSAPLPAPLPAPLAPPLSAPLPAEAQKISA